MRKKLIRFRDNANNPYLIQEGHAAYLTTKGRWHEEYFKNENPITLEVGCGWGEYTLGLARLFPVQNFVGLDVKGARLWKGATAAREEHLPNAAFLRVHAEHLMDHFLAGEVSRILLPFPDPYPSGRDKKRRLTAHRFLVIYQQLLKESGAVHVKTDDNKLFEETLDRLERMPAISVRCATHDLYASPHTASHHGLQTKYEKRFLAMGKTIKYLCFSFTGVPIQLPD